MNPVVITGPTASGKGALAVALARRLGGEIISVDSMKIYRGMDVGTAKPSPELRREIPFHLIDIVDPWEEFSTGRFLPLAIEAIAGVEARGRTAILQGGTALYIKALADGLFVGPGADWELRRSLNEEADRGGLAALYHELARQDPAAAAKIHPNDRRRIIRALEVIRSTGRPMTALWKESKRRLESRGLRMFAVGREREDLYRRIDRRVLEMVERGLFDEARRLLADPRGLSRSARKAIGYRQAIEGMARGEPERETVARIQRETRRFAKQQLTWFRKFPLSWLPAEEPEKLASRILEDLEIPGGTD